MGSSCTRGIAENIKEELWGYFALSGLLFLNIGIVLVVYALKRALPYPIVLEVFGLGLIIMGILTTLLSWYVHRQHRRKKPILSCAFGCCKEPPDPNSELEPPTPMSIYRQKNLYKHGVKFSRELHTRSLEQSLTPGNTIKMFSTPEFQKGCHPVNSTSETLSRAESSPLNFSQFLVADGPASLPSRSRQSRGDNQKYAEYMKRDTGGVEANGPHKFKVESLRQKKHVHPQAPHGAPSSTVVKAVYTDKGQVISQPLTVSSPILLKLSR